MRENKNNVAPIATVKNRSYNLGVLLSSMENALLNKQAELYNISKSDIVRLLIRQEFSEATLQKAFDMTNESKEFKMKLKLIKND